MCRDTVQLETAVNTISHEYLLEFTSEYDIPEILHPALPGPKDRVVDFPEDMDLFSLIRAPNPTKVKVGSRPRAPHEVPLLTLAANRVIEMDDPATASDSSGVPLTIERSPLDFSLEAVASDQGAAASELGLASTASMPEDAPTGVSDPDPLCFADPPARPSADVARSSSGVVVAKDPESENASSPTEVGSLGGIYRPEWGVTNGSLLDTPEACQDLVDHVAPPGYFFELRHMRNEDFLRQYNVNLARQVALGSQLRLSPRARNKNLEALLETEADMKKAAEDKSVGLIKELEDMRAQFSDLQVSYEHLSQHVASLKEQVSGEEKLKAAFKEFKRYEDERVERQWVVGHGLCLAMMKCAESLEMRQAFADVVSVGIAKGMSEGLKHRVEHGQAQLTVESIEAYDPEAEAKFVAALQSLKDLKYPLLDQLEGLKDAPMDVIMAALNLESDTGGMSHNIYVTSAPAPLSSPSPCTRRSDGVPVSVPTVVP
nr:hypothetical protein [Tanacetum cinerariifolium]